MAWAQFQLFETLPIRDPYEGSENALYSDKSLSAIGTTKEHLVIAVRQAEIKVINKQMEVVGEFQAYDSGYRVTFIETVPNSEMMLTVAEKDGAPAAIKLWDLHKVLLAAQTGSSDTSHKYHTLVSVHNGNNSYPMSCVLIDPNLTCLALGYTNGKVVLVRGDLKRDRGTKQRIVYDANDPVTGVHFSKSLDLIYLITTSSIVTVQTTGRNHGKPSSILSKKSGAGLGCSVVDSDSLYIIVALADSICYFSPLRKMKTIQLERRIKAINQFHKDYMVIVSLPEDDERLAEVIIFDLQQTHISYTLNIPNVSIIKVLIAWDEIYLLASNGVLYRVHEKPLNQQVEIILQRQLYAVAYKLAVRKDMPSKLLLDIDVLQGDYWYESGNFEEALLCYVRSLDLRSWNDSSADSVQEFIISIIMKFKDVPDTKYLTSFLGSIYLMALANTDHITLLLCCYCKHRMVEELDDFIDKLDLSKSKLQNLNFELIINLFKECGFFSQAIKLLNKLGQPNMIVAIQLNDLHLPHQCLEFIKGLPIDDVLSIVSEHSKKLLECLPLDTTQLLIKVFTGVYLPVETEPTVHEEVTDHSAENSGTLSSYLAFMNYLGSDVKEGALPEPAQPTYMPPRANMIFPSFVDNPYEFVIFLEAYIHTFEKYEGNKSDKKEVLHTLFERYLAMAKEDTDNSSDWRKKASSLLAQYPESMDRLSVLLLSHINGFQDGEKYSRGQQDFEDDLLRGGQASGDIAECINVVRQYGKSRPALYMMLLRYMVSLKTVFDKTTQKDMAYVLQNIQKHRIATPIEVVRILSSKDFTTLGLVKDYLIEYLDEQSQEISNSEKLIQSYESESTKNALKLNELKTQPLLLQNSKCSGCHLKLDFPMVHFKCKHSYHQRCLNERTFITMSKLTAGSTLKCPLCFREYDQVAAEREAQLEAKNQERDFKQLLEGTTDRFRVVTDFLGRGIMDEEYVPILED